MAPATFASPVPAGTPIVRGFILGQHEGIDYSVPVGTPVQAAAAGTVTQASNGDPGGYGNEVDIDHGGGWSTRYAHLSQFGVQVGQQVQAGQVVGLSGGAQGAPGAGNSTGPHLHFEVRSAGVALDPAQYVSGQAVGRLVGIGPGGIIPTPSDPLGGLDDLLGDVSDVPGDVVAQVLKPIRNMLVKLPAETFKVLTGGHSVTEIGLRLAELIGGAACLAVGGVLLVKIVVSGGEAGRTTAQVGRSTRQLARGATKRPSRARTPARRTSSPQRPTQRPTRPRPDREPRTVARRDNRRRRPDAPRPAHRVRKAPAGRSRPRELARGADVELM